MKGERSGSVDTGEERDEADEFVDAVLEMFEDAPGEWRVRSNGGVLAMSQRAGVLPAPFQPILSQGQQFDSIWNSMFPSRSSLLSPPPSV